MANPASAKAFTQTMDPADITDWTVTITQGSSGSEILQVGETISSYTLALTAEAVAAGLLLKTTGGYATTLTGLVLQFWLEVSGGSQAAAAFSGSGIALGLEITINTNSSPARKKQRTIVVMVAQL